MKTPLEISKDTRLGGFGHSAADDAETAGRDAVRAALAGRVPAAVDALLSIEQAGALPAPA